MLIIVVAANPKPRDCITLKNAYGTITACYSYGPDVFFTIDAFRTQRRMKRILCPQTVGFSGLTLNVFIKRPIGSPKRWHGGRFHN